MECFWSLQCEQAQQFGKRSGLPDCSADSSGNTKVGRPKRDATLSEAEAMISSHINTVTNIYSHLRSVDRSSTVKPNITQRSQRLSMSAVRLGMADVAG